MPGGVATLVADIGRGQAAAARDIVTGMLAALAASTGLILVAGVPAALFAGPAAVAAVIAAVVPIQLFAGWAVAGRCVRRRGAT